MTRDYSAEEMSDADSPEQAKAFAGVAAQGGRVVSAFIHARKPAAA